MHDIRPRRRVPSTRHWIGLGISFLFLGLLAQMSAGFVHDEDWCVHGVWCLGGLVLTVPIFAAAVRSPFDFLLTNHRAMFVYAFALYFLFGALLLAAGPVDQAEYSLAFYPIGVRAALRVDTMNAIGFGVALVVSGITRGGFLGREARRAASIVNQVKPTTAIALMLTVGAAALLAVIPVDLESRGGVVSGILRSTAQLPVVSVLIASAVQGRCEIVLRLAAIGLALIQCAIGLVLFNKSAVMLPLAALTAGLAWRFGSSRVLPLGMIGLTAVFMMIGGPTAYARNVFVFNGGGILEARWTTFLEGLSAWDDNSATHYSAWARLCHVPVQAAALDFYDNGDGGDDLTLVPWLPIPRMFAASKPVITRSAVDFNVKLTGSDTSSTGMGVFVSGYYNGGWVGLLLAGALCGLLLSLTSAVATNIVEQRGFLMLPLALLGLYTAFRVDGDIVADYLGSFVVVLTVLAITTCFSRLKC